jgi:hypothetical protein
MGVVRLVWYACPSQPRSFAMAVWPTGLRASAAQTPGPLAGASTRSVTWSAVVPQGNRELGTTQGCGRCRRLRQPQRDEQGNRTCPQRGRSLARSEPHSCSVVDSYSILSSRHFCWLHWPQAALISQILASRAHCFARLWEYHNPAARPPATGSATPVM